MVVETTEEEEEEELGVTGVRTQRLARQPSLRAVAEVAGC